MNVRFCSFAAVVRPAVLLICLAVARPVLAQDAVALKNLREQYAAMMTNFEKILRRQNDLAGAERARQGREAMRGLSDQQLAKLYTLTRIPDLSVVVTAT